MSGNTKDKKLNKQIRSLTLTLEGLTITCFYTYTHEFNGIDVKTKSQQKTIIVSEKDIINNKQILLSRNGNQIDIDIADNIMKKKTQNASNVNTQQQRREYAKKITQQYNEADWIHAFSDASIRGAFKTRAGIGIYIELEPTITWQFNRQMPVSNINYAEMNGIYHTLLQIDKYKNTKKNKLVIFCDNKTCIDVLTKKKTAKLSLIPVITQIEQLIEKLSKKYTIKLEWIPAHSGIKGNDTADLL